MTTTAILLLLSVSATPGPGTLVGRVTDEAGAPIAGAVVDIYTARPRVGIPTTCPSCYRDCAKQAKTDGAGRFAIMQLDPILQFRVLALAPGRRPMLTELIDPAAAELNVKLEPMPSGLPDDRLLQGRVVDERGKPLVGVMVSPTGAKTREKRWWGALPGVDAAAVTDAEGRFAIMSRDAKLGLDLEATAPGYAPFQSQLFDLDGSEREIRLRRGADVTGRLVYQGQPVQGRVIGIVQRDRSAGRFVGAVELASDDQGRFHFMDLLPGEDYVIYSDCDGVSDAPALKVVKLHTAGEGQMTELGDLTMIDGLTLAGRVELPAGAKLPAEAKLLVTRVRAWDWCELPLGKDGAFDVRGLPPEVYGITVVAPGFEIDPSRLRFQAVGANEFALRLREDRRDLVVPLKAKRR